MNILLKNIGYLKYFFLLLIIIWYGFLIAKKIDLTDSDIGRHLKNGEIIYNSLSIGTGDWKNILYKNTYSFTEPTHYFVNHHWGSGLIFYMIFKIGGFLGLSIFYMLLHFSAFIIFFYIASKISSLWYAGIASVFAFPFIAQRIEIRPELFTYIFIPLIFWILWKYRLNSISFKWLWLIPFLIMLWVNLNLYFIVGIFLLIFFISEEMIIFAKNRTSFSQKQKVANLLIILSASLVASFCSPWGIKGTLYPFFISRDIGVAITELQPIFDFSKMGIQIYFLLFLSGSALILAIPISITMISKKFPFVLIWWNIFLLMFFLKYNRNVALFGFFSWILVSLVLKQFYELKSNRYSLLKLLSFSATTFIILFSGCFYTFKQSDSNKKLSGIGLKNNTQNSADFIKINSISGPIFNDFSTGSYLIYHLYPNEKVFVDQRPEAYGASFFKNTYFPALNDDAKWEELDKKYDFNIIFMRNKEKTNFENAFLERRIKSKNWNLVYSDRDFIILLKNNSTNSNFVLQLASQNKSGPYLFFSI